MGIYQHFRKEERPFIDQVVSWVERVENLYEARITDFLDPREQQIIAAVIGEHHDVVKFSFFGGHEHTERKQAKIAPFYESFTEDDFELTIMEATYHKKFVELIHPDVLGAFMSLGIERRKLGDILVQDGVIQFAIAKDIGTYVLQHFTNVKNTTIRLREVDYSSLEIKPTNWLEKNITISSLRIDAAISEIYNLSRKLASSAVAKGYVKVNFRVVDDGKFSVEAGDLISLRGQGRSKIIETDGVTRKNRIRVKIGILQ